ncbi:hydroxyethylthiazole kinase [Corynebacterium sp.]|uniref:hydroxyethylthiazole kinase n=1 Tax=Corynebacterium sp. TaxID=1720 RepID=UPI0039C8A30D
MGFLPGEAGHSVAVANGVLLNPETPSAEQFLAIREAASSSTNTGTPWVLDPASAAGLQPRSALIDDIAHLQPAAIRGDASENAAFTEVGAGAHGTDLAGALGTIIAFTCTRDLRRRVDPARTYSCQNRLHRRGRNSSRHLKSITAVGSSSYSVVASIVAQTLKECRRSTPRRSNSCEPDQSPSHTTSPSTPSRSQLLAQPCPSCLLPFCLQPPVLQSSISSATPAWSLPT